VCTQPTAAHPLQHLISGDFRGNAAATTYSVITKLTNMMHIYIPAPEFRILEMEMYGLSDTSTRVDLDCQHEGYA